MPASGDADRAPRIPPLENPSSEVSELLAKTTIFPDGPVLNIFRTMAHNGRLLKRVNVLGGYFLAHGLLPARERELVILRTAWRSACRYEWGQHVLIAREVGLSDELIEAAASEEAWSSMSAGDAALMAFVDGLVATADVDDGQWQTQRARWSDEQMMELVMLVGFYRMIAGYLNAVRVSAERDLPGWPMAGAH